MESSSTSSSVYRSAPPVTGRGFRDGSIDDSRDDNLGRDDKQGVVDDPVVNTFGPAVTTSGHLAELDSHRQGIGRDLCLDFLVLLAGLGAGDGPVVVDYGHAATHLGVGDKQLRRARKPLMLAKLVEVANTSNAYGGTSKPAWKLTSSGSELAEWRVYVQGSARTLDGLSSQGSARTLSRPAVSSSTKGSARTPSSSSIKTPSPLIGLRADPARDPDVSEVADRCFEELPALAAVFDDFGGAAPKAISGALDAGHSPAAIVAVAAKVSQAPSAREPVAVFVAAIRDMAKKEPSPAPPPETERCEVVERQARVVATNLSGALSHSELITYLVASCNLTPERSAEVVDEALSKKGP
ncbi:MAG: hypothetical protein GY871_04860 [Actinomycetales bacterium]|nr:hypothetical protein [Actinomycetales bacterium]